jgi:hypothetical protein
MLIAGDRVSFPAGTIPDARCGKLHKAGHRGSLTGEVAMLSLILAGWTAMCGAAENGKLPKEWTAAYHALKWAKVYHEIDWVAYYKNYSYRVNTGVAPQWVSPTLQWAVPNSALNGPPMVTYPGAYGSYEYPPQPEK